MSEQKEQYQVQAGQGPLHFSNPCNELFAAVREVQSQLNPIDPGGFNPFHKSKYATLPQVVGALQGLIYENGLAFTQVLEEEAQPHFYQEPGLEGRDNSVDKGNFADRIVTYNRDLGPVLVLTVVHVESGQWGQSRVRVRYDRPGPQPLKSYIAYMKRTQLEAFFGVVVEEEDDDGNTASRDVSRQQQSKRQQRQTRQSGKSTQGKQQSTSQAKKEAASKSSEPNGLERFKTLAKVKVGKLPEADKLDEYLESKSVTSDFLPKDAREFAKVLTLQPQEAYALLSKWPSDFDDETSVKNALYVAFKRLDSEQK